MGDNGSAGRVTIQSLGQCCKVTYTGSYAAQATVDRAITGFLKIVAGSKVQRECDKDAGEELKHLSSRVARRLSGNPVDDNAGRQMIDLCEFGAGTLDPDVVPLFDDEGLVRLEVGEMPIWTGTASTAAAEDAKGASGHEQFRTLWRSPEPAALILTTRRLIYDVRKFARGDGSWILAGGIEGLVLAGAGTLRGRALRGGRTRAGQVRHVHLMNLVTGADSRPIFSSPSTVTATMLQLPDRVLRVSLELVGGASAARGLAGSWTKSTAADRIDRFPNWRQVKRRIGRRLSLSMRCQPSLVDSMGKRG
jgi:hypothetical protein